MDRLLWPVTALYAVLIVASLFTEGDAATIHILGTIFLVGAVLRDLIIARPTSQETDHAE